jgi:hypothetical protein
MATWLPAAFALVCAFDLIVVLVLGTARSRSGQTASHLEPLEQDPAASAGPDTAELARVAMN